MDVASVIRPVLKKPADNDTGRSPKKSVTCKMMVECDQLENMLEKQTILEGSSSTLHLD